MTFTISEIVSFASITVSYDVETSSDKNPTTISFNSGFDATKTYTFRNGVAPDYTKPTVIVNPTEATGKVTYKSSDTDVVEVGEDGTLNFTGKTKYDTEATITAQFIGTGNYTNSEEISYKVKNVEAKASLAFSESTVTVVYGKESEFVAPTLTLLDAEGNEVKGQTLLYAVTPTKSGVVEINDETGEITKWIKPGNVTIEALVFEGDYENMSASYALNYEKANTTIEFAEGEHSVDINKSLSVTAVLKANDVEVSDATVSYSSSDDKIATVDENGNVNAVAEGNVKITAAFAGNDYYNAATSVEYDIKVKDPNNVFYESFNKVNPTGQGGTDGKFDIGNAVIDVKDFDNNEANNLWQTSGYVGGAKQCLRLASGSKAGSVTTPRISYSGAATLTFKAGAWKGKLTTGAVVVTITNGKLLYKGRVAASQTIDIPNAEFGDFEMDIVGASEGMTINFASATSSDNQFFLDEVKIITTTKSGEVTLTQEDNDVTVKAVADDTSRKYNVTLDRSMQADGGWYTFCVPFDIDDISTTPLKDAEIRQYQSMTGSVMNFEATTSLKAAHAYLVKPTTDIVNPVFNNVTVSLRDKVVDGANGYEFVGIHSATDLKTDGTNLFLGEANKFYIPTEDDHTLKALRGYFVAPSSESGAQMAIRIDDTTTSIAAINGNAATMNGKVYNLSGQYVGNDVKALPKGIYIVNGKKYIVK